MNNRLNQLLNQCDPRSHIQPKLLITLFEELSPDLQEQLTVEHHISDVNTWIDLAFPKAKVAIYCDGFCPHIEPDAFSRDRYQSRELQLQGWLVLRFSQEDIEKYVSNAVNTILKAIDRSKTNYQAVNYNNRGNAYSDKSDYDHAIADHTKAIQLNSNYAEAYNNRGIAYRKKGNHTCAIADYTKAIELKPDFAKAYNNRGNAYSDKGNYGHAIDDYTKAIKLKPDFINAYYNRGIAYLRKDDHDRSAASLAEAKRLRNR